VAEVAPWYTNSPRTLIGAVARLDIASASRVSGKWSFLTYDESERTRPPYRVASFRLDVADVRQVLVFVDFGAGRAP
jgi:hypothetical protein